MLRYAAGLYAAGWVLHTADHLRRGTDVVTHQVLALGLVSGVLQVLAIVLVFRNHRLAPVWAVAVGLPNGLGIAAVHLLPKWSASLSDAYTGAHGTGVTAFSWLVTLIEVAGALLFAAAGWAVLRESRTPSREPSAA
jgi:hypothetical protein